MFLELIATLVAGMAAAGLMMLVNRALGRRLPKWLTPVAAGLAMLAATISNEYGWYGRTSAALPEGLVIAQTVENRAFYRPWTYAKPYVERFVAVDAQSLRTNDAHPDQRMADILFFGRWSPVNQMTVLADCAGGRRAALADGVGFAADGSVTGADWVSVAADDPILTTICGV